MPKEYDSCVNKAKRNLPKTYKKGNKRVKSNPYAYCSPILKNTEKKRKK